MDRRSLEVWKSKMDPVLKSKVREFRIEGLLDVEAKHIWDYLMEEAWRDEADIRLHKVVQDIFHLKAGTYMNHMRIGALTQEEQGKDLMTSIQMLSQTNNET